MTITNSQTMRAARFHGPLNILIEDIPIPPPPLPHEVTISPVWGGICGTDLHEYTSGPLATPKSGHPHRLTGGQSPITLGHEFCGQISMLPEGYSGSLEVGMNVMVDPRITCGECVPCRTGADHVCKFYGFVGLSGGCGGGGGFSERVNVPQRMCYVLPEHVNIHDAVLIEPLAVGRHALTASGIAGPEWAKFDVLVLGGGPIGISVLYNLRALGVKRVFVSEPTRKRREMVITLGLTQAEDVLDPLVQDIPNVIRSRTDDEGADVVFDCAGVQAGMEAGIDTVKRQGVHVNVAGWDKPVSQRFRVGSCSIMTNDSR